MLIISRLLKFSLLRTPIYLEKIPVGVGVGALLAVAAVGVSGLGGANGGSEHTAPKLVSPRAVVPGLEWATGEQFVVPRVFSATLPADMGAMAASARKQVFITTILPLVLRENDHIRAQRERIVDLSERRSNGLPVSANDRAWLKSMAGKYRTSPDDPEELLHRVDVVPTSLAIAQAAVESGWGTSRFALNGNALFGQWTSVQGGGMVPLGRDKGATHEVKAYDALAGSVRDYMKNLNAHRAYAGLRKIRAEMRKLGQAPRGHELTAALIHYSARGEDYVHSLRAIIRGNALNTLDSARLDDQKFAGLDLG